MNQERFGEFIKQIRKKNNLTKKQLADKYNVTYQTVSKWENGKNIPDTLLIKQMSKDFNISLEEMFEGKINTSKKEKNGLFLKGFLFISVILVIVLTILLQSNNNFNFKTLSSNCDDFDLSGSISYNDKKSSIYITNIKYCGTSDDSKYEEIECILYEANDTIAKKISSCSYNEQKDITLEEYLNTVTLFVDDYKRTCKEYKEDSLYLSINAKARNGKVTTYKIPLSLNKSCSD